VVGLKLDRRYLLLSGLLLLAIYVVIPQLGSLHASWHLLGRLQVKWLLVAIALEGLTFLSAAGTYYWLAFKPLKYGQLVLIQFAAMFINRLLPAGIGALGANYTYLKRQNHSPAQAASAVTMNNTLGIIGHLLVSAFILAIYSRSHIHPVWPHITLSQVVVTIGLLAAISVSLAVILQVQRLAGALQSWAEQLLTYRRRLQQLLAALGASISLTAANLLCLTTCSLALGIHLSPVAVLIVFSLGLGAGTVVPAPGGLGGFEAGAFGGLVAYDLPASPALALVLLVRLVSYWLPLIAGAGAFAFAEKKILFS